MAINIGAIPTEVMWSILEYVDHPKSGQVCKAWQEVAKAMETNAFSHLNTDPEIAKREYLRIVQERNEELCDVYAINPLPATLRKVQECQFLLAHKSANERHFCENDCLILPSRYERESNWETVAFWKDCPGGYLPKRVGMASLLYLLSAERCKIRQLPNTFPHLKSLQRLSLAQNELRVLPPEIGSFSNLTHLSLNGNRLVCLPIELFSLRNLKKLYVNENNLREIPSEIGQLTSLNELDLSKNLLRALPEEIGSLANLASLKAGGNLFETLPQKIMSMVSLKTLYI